MFSGRKIATDENERSFVNDPINQCDIGPGFIITRHGLQRLCPHITVCQRDYTSINVASGLQLSRCILRFLNQTCSSAGAVSKLFLEYTYY